MKNLTLKKKKTMNKNLYLLRGIPGAGKSTLAKQLGDSHFETDGFFMVDGEYKFDPTKLRKAHEWCQSQVELATVSYTHLTLPTKRIV